MKENMHVEPTGTMPFAGAMPQMQANPNISPIQSKPSEVSPAMMPVKPNPMEVSPSMMNQMPVMANPMGVSPAMMPMKPNPMEVSPSMMNQMPAMPNPMGVMPAAMNTMPMMCCPYLMNMQCPMTYGQNVMGAGMSNPMLTGVSPAMGNVSPAYGQPNAGMNSMPGMEMRPYMNQYYGW